MHIVMKRINILLIALVPLMFSSCRIPGSYHYDVNPQNLCAKSGQVYTDVKHCIELFSHIVWIDKYLLMTPQEREDFGTKIVGEIHQIGDNEYYFGILRVSTSGKSIFEDGARWVMGYDRTDQVYVLTNDNGAISLTESSDSQPNYIRMTFTDVSTQGTDVHATVDFHGKTTFKGDKESSYIAFETVEGAPVKITSIWHELWSVFESKGKVRFDFYFEGEYTGEWAVVDFVTDPDRWTTSQDWPQAS